MGNTWLDIFLFNPWNHVEWSRICLGPKVDEIVKVDYISSHIWFIKCITKWKLFIFYCICIGCAKCFQKSKQSMLHCHWNVLESESGLYFMAFFVCWAYYLKKKWKQFIFSYLWGPRIGADEDETSEEPSLGSGAKCARHLSTIQPIVDQRL